MLRKRFLIFAGIAVVMLGSAAGFQQLVLTKCVVDRDGLKVLVADDFPKDTAVELNLGPQDRRLFRADGKDGKVENTLTYVNKDSFIVVKRKETEAEAYSMIFDTTMKDGRMFELWDLNCDGEWDMRMGPAILRKQSTIRGSSELATIGFAPITLTGLNRPSPKRSSMASTTSLSGDGQSAEPRHDELKVCISRKCGR